ncbi:hypothetical protein Tco_1061800, partial [Tanacetum coccineum]
MTTRPTNTPVGHNITTSCVGRDERADSTTVIPRSFVVRTKDVPRILGEGNSMLMNISEVFGASLSLSVDMRNVMNRTMKIKAWGRREEVDVAETLIFNLITEVSLTSTLTMVNYFEKP